MKYLDLDIMCTPRIDLFDEVSNAPNKDRMKMLCPQEVDA
jgi:hypothetical protein